MADVCEFLEGWVGGKNENLQAIDRVEYYRIRGDCLEVIKQLELGGGESQA